MSGDFTLLVAAAAGLLSFLSPCVLPLVPAYLGQLAAVAVAAESGAAGVGAPARAGRGAAVRHALAYVAGFGSIFTLLGVTAAFVGGVTSGLVGPLRTIGGIVLVVMGLSLAGILRVPALERTWRPLDAGAAAGLAGARGGLALAPGDGGLGSRLGARLVAGRTGLAASFALGAIFAVGWTPCIGVILGGILTLAATGESRVAGGLLLVAYSAGLGLPFVLIAAFTERLRGPLALLARHGRAVALTGGLLVAGIGLAMALDLLVLLPRWFQFVPVL